jgi:enoyl-CoA hydratase
VRLRHVRKYVGMSDDTMNDDPVLLERRDDGVAVVTLNNGKVNALSGAVVSAIHRIADELQADLPGAVVVTGGEKIFAAGADISEFGGPDEARSITDNIHGALDALAALPRFVIAAVSGYALGGGCELALACDYRIAGERAVFGQPEILLGTIPGGGGTQRLARAVGASRAKEISITGRQVKADEALRIGLVDEVVAGDVLHERALSLAAEVASGPVLSQAFAKEAIDRGLSTSLADGLLIERDLFVESFRTNDSQVGVASFLEHGPGKADFTGT